MSHGQRHGADSASARDRALGEIARALLKAGAKPRQAYELAGLVLVTRWADRLRDSKTRDYYDRELDDPGGEQMAEWMGVAESTYWLWRSNFRKLMHCDPEHLRIAPGVYAPPVGRMAERAATEELPA